MFKVNDVLIYGSQGVCEIVAIEEKSAGGAKKQYYVLKLDTKEDLMEYILNRLKNSGSSPSGQ